MTFINVTPITIDASAKDILDQARITYSVFMIVSAFSTISDPSTRVLNVTNVVRWFTQKFVGEEWALKISQLPELVSRKIAPMV